MSVRQLESAWAALAKQANATTGFKVDESSVLTLLAAIAERSGRTPQKVIADLRKAGSKPAMLAIVKRGMTADEQQALAAKLDSDTLPMAKAVRDFLEAVAGRKLLTGEVMEIPGLTITKVDKNGIHGVTKPNAEVQIINQSAAPAGRLHTDDFLTTGTADSDGNFSAKWDGRVRKTRDMDLVDVRAEGVKGVLPIRAKNTGRRDRNDELALFRIMVRDQGDGRIKVENINAGSRPIAVRGATVRFTNARTGEQTDVTLDKDGDFPKDLYIPGQGGDRLMIAVTDHIKNQNFKTVTNRLPVPKNNEDGSVDIEDDPGLHKDDLDKHKRPKYREYHYQSPLMKGGKNARDVKGNIQVTDIFQGALGNCYFPAAGAALVNIDPKYINEMFKKNARDAKGRYMPDADGNYWITFKVRHAGGRVTDVNVKVDTDLWVRSDGTPLYAAGVDADDPRAMELYWPLIEKAYAKWLGSYNAIGNGGDVSQVFEDLTGLPKESHEINEKRPNDVWRWIMDALKPEGGKRRRPVAFGTHDDSMEHRYRGTGMYTDHAYSILDCREDANGTRWVQLRNPWGESEPGDDGENDGIFWIELDKVMRLVADFYTVRETD